MDLIIEDGYLRKYMGDDPHVVIPDEVVIIGFGCFSGRDDIVSVTVPASVKKVCSNAFSECSRLESVTILGNAILGDFMFYKCEALKELNTPNGLKEIGDSCFIGCRNLSPSSVSDMKFELNTYIGDRDLGTIWSFSQGEFEKRTYSWEEYKRITLEALKYDLIHITDECDELAGPVEPRISREKRRIKNDMILVKDGHFAGCIEESDLVLYVNNKLDHNKKYELIRPDDKPVNIYSSGGNHCVFYSHCYINAMLRSRNAPDGEK